MSVTFTTEPAVIGYAVECCCGKRSETMATFEQAEARLPTITRAELTCFDELCAEYQLLLTSVEAEEPPAVNVTNSHAQYLLEILGLHGTALFGEQEPEAFLGRVLLAIAILPTDAGVPAHIIPGSAGREIECGRREGYAQAVLSQLRELAECGALRHRLIIWG